MRAVRPARAAPGWRCANQQCDATTASKCRGPNKEFCSRNRCKELARCGPSGGELVTLNEDAKDKRQTHRRAGRDDCRATAEGYRAGGRECNTQAAAQAGTGSTRAGARGGAEASCTRRQVQAAIAAVSLFEFDGRIVRFYAPPVD